MLITANIKKCRCTKEGEVDGNNDEDICNWPNLHADIKELMDKGIYRSVPIGSVENSSNGPIFIKKKRALFQQKNHA